MSSRLLRIDATRLEAMVFRADSVRFEACASFRTSSFSGGVEPELCECGWLEADHSQVTVSRRQFLGRRPRRRAAAAVRRAS